MITRLLSITKVCRAVNRSAPYVRALAAAGLVDVFICGNRWRAFPAHAIEQIKAHEAKVKAESREEAR
jgi:hypothetical protein